MKHKQKKYINSRKCNFMQFNYRIGFFHELTLACILFPCFWSTTTISLRLVSNCRKDSILRKLISYILH